MSNSSSSKGGGIKKIFGKFDYNSPVILTFAFICVAVFILDTVSVGRLNKSLFTTYAHSGFGLKSIANSLLYVFGHANLSHLTGNMTLFLLVGPIVEERYGSKKLVIMMASTAIVTAILHGLLSSAGSGLLGASGIVFMLIVLSAFTGKSDNKIPITLVLVCIIYIGGEVADGIFIRDNVSQLGHIVGGVCGLFWGIMHKKLL